MKFASLIMTALLGACSIASAQDTLLAGHVQRVVLQPSGTEQCPPPCAVPDRTDADGVHHVCVSNQGGCQMMEVKVDRVYRGANPGRTRQFKSRIGEWGPSFPVTQEQIVVMEEGGNVFWSVVTEQNGKRFVDPKRLGSIGHAAAPSGNENGLIALDELLESGARR